MRRMISGTGTGLTAGAGGGGCGAIGGSGAGGMGIAVPKAGGGAVGVCDGSTRSASPASSSRRGTPNAGSPRSCIAVFGMLTCPHQRLSIPRLTAPPNISSGTRGPSASWTLSGVYSSTGVFTWSSYPPQSSQVSMNTVESQPPPWTTASTDCQIRSIPWVTFAGGCSSSGLLCQSSASAGSCPACASARNCEDGTTFGDPLSCV